LTLAPESISNLATALCLKGFRRENDTVIEVKLNFNLKSYIPYLLEKTISHDYIYLY